MQRYDIAIIGGGAAGLACAVRLKELDKNLSVVIIEKGERAGKKIAASGNGQGNVSNADMTPSHYHGSGAVIARKLCCEGRYDVLSLFDFLFVKDKLGRIYPAGKQASALSDCLLKKIAEQGVELKLSSEVVTLEKGFEIGLADGGKIAAERVVLAAGGKAQKQFGTDGSAYALAERFGHTVTPLQPSLVQLKCDVRHTKTLKGIRADCRVKVFDGKGKILGKSNGDVIFTEYGVSGNAIFYASAYCAGITDATLSLEFLPDFSLQEVKEVIARRICLGYPRSELLSGMLHNQLGRAIMKRCDCDDPEVIAATVKNFTLKVGGSLGFDYAQVTRGGIPAEEVDESLQSRKVNNLYLAGEILDVDGDCGGYNLTFAFASGMHIAKSIINGYDTDD